MAYCVTELTQGQQFVASIVNHPIINKPCMFYNSFGCKNGNACWWMHLDYNLLSNEPVPPQKSRMMPTTIMEYLKEIYDKININVLQSNLSANAQQFEPELSANMEECKLGTVVTAPNDLCDDDDDDDDGDEFKCVGSKVLLSSPILSHSTVTPNAFKCDPVDQKLIPQTLQTVHPQSPKSRNTTTPILPFILPKLTEFDVTLPALLPQVSQIPPKPPDPIQTVVSDLTEAYQEEAELEKSAGNKSMKEQNYLDASYHYDRAILLYPTAIYHANQSAATYYLKEYDAAIYHASMAIELDKHYVKGYIRKGLASFATNSFQVASDNLLIAVDLMRNDHEMQPLLVKYQKMLKICKQKLK
jgi:tetratricopeptide (TPR) repeat protein